MVRPCIVNRFQRSSNWLIRTVSAAIVLNFQTVNNFIWLKRKTFSSDDPQAVSAN